MITNNEELRPKLIELNERIVNMCYHVYGRRPTCAKLISEYNKWGINLVELKHSETYQEQFDQVQTVPNSFFDKFIKTKIKSM